MTPPPEGWHLVVEFVKALAGPVAAVLAVWIASIRAVHGFRAQKLIERRLDWYEKVIKQLDVTARAYDSLGRDPQRPELRENVEREIKAMHALNDGALMYADSAGVRALATFNINAGKALHVPDLVKGSEELRTVCGQAQYELVSEVRKDLSLEPLQYRGIDIIPFHGLPRHEPGGE